ncbi:hypothetical protein M0804_009280 [Polistes exclamans]|nr:hypothetical protein M0804_009280 [Polistes exclamans]
MPPAVSPRGLSSILCSSTNGHSLMTNIGRKKIYKLLRRKLLTASTVDGSSSSDGGSGGAAVSASVISPIEQFEKFMLKLEDNLSPWSHAEESYNFSDDDDNDKDNYDDDDDDDDDDDECSSVDLERETSLGLFIK